MTRSFFQQVITWTEEPECTVSALQEVSPGRYWVSVTFHVDQVRNEYEGELTTRQANDLMRKYDLVVFRLA